MRVFADSSTLIALARIGKLEVLRTLFKKIVITTAIEREILAGGSPDSDVLRKAVGNWITVVGFKGDIEALRKYGLDSGEASLFLASGQDDRLILDEANVRRFAETRGLRFTGLIGLLVAAVRAGKLTKEEGLDVINKLAAGDFRMSVELYLWAREKIERGRRRDDR